MQARLLVLVLLAACGSNALGDAAETSNAQTSAATNSDESGAETTSSGEGSSSGVAPGESTAPAEETTRGSSDEGPGMYFDVGVLPDAPGVDPRCMNNVDIVFVIDVSTSMGEFIGLLSDEILAVDAAVQELNLPQEPHYGLAVFVDDAQLLNSGNPYDDVLALQADFDMWAAFTSSNQQVGGGNGNFTFPENSIDGLWLAAEEFDWRPAATTDRLVIHVTDDTFWDGPTNQNGVAIVHGYAETVEALQDNTVRVFSFADQIGGSCECEDVTPGWSNPYMGMTAIPEATDGGVFDINQILSSMISLTASIDEAVENSHCDPYTPVG
ncbi:MAG TPA: vWA domain-containing protein [Nannocystaceae bacterium]|nr:vWA domain-containing protein [Nannocystaceae bacterium]